MSALTAVEAIVSVCAAAPATSATDASPGPRGLRHWTSAAAAASSGRASAAAIGLRSYLRSYFARDNRAMEVSSLEAAEAFVTADGSLIRELVHTASQSLAEATLEDGQATQRHYHRASEEIYFVLAGRGEIEVDDDVREVRPGDAVLMPPGARHRIEAREPLRFLCCCAPPYSHADTFFA